MYYHHYMDAEPINMAVLANIYWQLQIVLQQTLTFIRYLWLMKHIIA